MITGYTVTLVRCHEFYFTHNQWSGRVKNVFVGDSRPRTISKKTKYRVSAWIRPYDVGDWMHVEFLTDLRPRIESWIDPVEVCRTFIVPYLSKQAQKQSGLITSRGKEIRARIQKSVTGTL